MIGRRAIRALVVVAGGVALVAAPGACSDGDPGAGGAGGAPSPSGDELTAQLTAIAEEVIVPAYEELGAALASLRESAASLCAAPSAASLEEARLGWRRASAAWQASRAGGVGPAMDARLSSDVAFAARAPNVDELLAGGEPVDRASVAQRGAAVRGLYALEIALFGTGSDALAAPEGARRCEYASSVAALAEEAAAPVVEAWSSGAAVDALVEGLDDGLRSSVSALVNETSGRLQEVDRKGLRDMAAAASVDELAESRRDGPAAHRLADLRALASGATAVLGDEDVGLTALVAEVDPDLAERLIAGRAAVEESLAALPDSVAAGLGDPGAVAAAAQAVTALQVLTATELASELGVTISFSDADGDS